MEELVTAVSNYIQNSDLYTDINEEVYFESNPLELDENDTPIFPYIVYNLEDEDDSSNFCKDEIIEVPMLVNIVSDENSPSEMFTWQKRVKDLFRFAEFPIDNYSLTYCKREGGYYDRIPTVPRTWQFVENYRIRISS